MEAGGCQAGTPGSEVQVQTPHRAQNSDGTWGRLGNIRGPPTQRARFYPDLPVLLLGKQIFLLAPTLNPGAGNRPMSRDLCHISSFQMSSSSQ